MVRKISLVAVAIALAAVFAFAQEGEKKTLKVTGYVVDNMCAGMHGSEEEAKNHPNACALMPACEKSGFVVVAGDKTYKLDEAGNKLAAEALKTMGHIDILINSAGGSQPPTGHDSLD